MHGEGCSLKGPDAGPSAGARPQGARQTPNTQNCRGPQALPQRPQWAWLKLVLTH